MIDQFSCQLGDERLIGVYISLTYTVNVARPQAARGSGFVSLYHRRLVIMDMSGGTDPTSGGRVNSVRERNGEVDTCHLPAPALTRVLSSSICGVRPKSKRVHMPPHLRVLNVFEFPDPPLLRRTLLVNFSQRASKPHNSSERAG